MRKGLLMSFLLIAGVSASLPAAVDAQLEIVASKPRDDTGSWQWHADLVNLYQGDSTLVNGTNVNNGDQIEVDILSFPTKDEGAWQDLFRLEFESDAFATVGLEAFLSPFIDSHDALSIQPVEYHVAHAYAAELPEGFNGPSIPQNSEETGTAGTMNGFQIRRSIMESAQVIPIEGTDGTRGHVRYSLSVSGRFSSSVADEDLSGRTWVLPVSVKMEIVGQ